MISKRWPRMLGDVLRPLGLALALAFGAERLGHKRLQLNTHSCLQLIVDDADDGRVADLTKLAETRKAGPIPAVGLGSRIRQSEWVPKVPPVALRPCQKGANDTHRQNWVPNGPFGGQKRTQSVPSDTHLQHWNRGKRPKRPLGEVCRARAGCAGLAKGRPGRDNGCCLCHFSRRIEQKILGLQSPIRIMAHV